MEPKRATDLDRRTLLQATHPTGRPQPDELPIDNNNNKNYKGSKRDNNKNYKGSKRDNNKVL